MEKPLKKILIQHFSHEHTMEHTHVLPTTDSCVCFGCKRDILAGKRFYKCKICPFYLHQVCYDIPQKTQHPADPNHQLTLLAMASPPDIAVVCRACQRLVTGFYYNCATCGTFYHPLCLSTPLSVKLPVHPHALKLEFLPPYDFQCDICNEPSYLGWLYRCALCEFDAHISCAAMDWQAKLEMLTKPKSLDGGSVIGTDEKTNGPMKPLKEEMKGIGGRTNQGIFDSQSQDLLSISLFQDKGTPSHQLFSIDFAKHSTNHGQASEEACLQKLKLLEIKDSSSQVSYSIKPQGENEGDSMLSSQVFGVPKKVQSSHSYVNASNKIGKGTSSTGVKPHAWWELGQESYLSKGEAPKFDKAAVKYQAQKPNIRRCRCSWLCW